MATKKKAPKREIWFLCLSTDGQVVVAEKVPEPTSMWLPFTATPPLTKAEAGYVLNRVCKSMRVEQGTPSFWFISDPKTQGDLRKQFGKAVTEAAASIRTGK